MAIDIRRFGPERHGEFAIPGWTAFGMASDPERIARVARIPEITQRLGAFEDDALVGSAGGSAMTMTTPGGSAPVVALSMVGVLPSHRRRGVLRALMRAHFDDTRAAGRAVSVLWAAESAIYGRFGYGAATWAGALSVERAYATFHRPPPAGGTIRLLDEEAAMELVPPVWDRMRAVTPGMMSRSREWWEGRRIGDFARGGPPLQRAAFFEEGRAVGYALYRFGHSTSPTGTSLGSLQVAEAMGTTPAATARVWHYLFTFDLAHRIEALVVPSGHPILHLVKEPRRLGLTVSDGLWVRLVDVEEALAARSWGSREAITIEVRDAFCPENEGRYRIDGASGEVGRTPGEADLRLDVACLGAAYLGGTTLRRLADAGEVEELTPGSIECADLLFRSARAPWCPEIF